MNDPIQQNEQAAEPLEQPELQESPRAQPVTEPTHVPSFDPRRRLRELLSIPEGQRTDPQWDELIELEIQMAPGNRVGAEMPRSNPRPQGGRGSGSPGGSGQNPSGHSGQHPGTGPGGGGNWKRGAGRKFSKPKKPTPAV